ncbi:MAG: hypothetical protein KDD69_12240 [Bdellovibrionales bacterium]|nr:hypothetical protein [Bdellovibrionales bacterium]
MSISRATLVVTDVLYADLTLSIERENEPHPGEKDIRYRIVLSGDALPEPWIFEEAENETVSLHEFDEESVAKGEARQLAQYRTSGHQVNKPAKEFTSKSAKSIMAQLSDGTTIIGFQVPPNLCFNGGCIFSAEPLCGLGQDPNGKIRLLLSKNAFIPSSYCLDGTEMIPKPFAPTFEQAEFLRTSFICEEQGAGGCYGFRPKMFRKVYLYQLKVGDVLAWENAFARTTWCMTAENALSTGRIAIPIRHLPASDPAWNYYPFRSFQKIPKSGWNALLAALEGEFPRSIGLEGPFTKQNVIAAMKVAKARKRHSKSNPRTLELGCFAKFAGNVVSYLDQEIPTSKPLRLCLEVLNPRGDVAAYAVGSPAQSMATYVWRPDQYAQARALTLHEVGRRALRKDFAASQIGESDCDSAPVAIIDHRPNHDEMFEQILKSMGAFTN